MAKVGRPKKYAEYISIGFRQELKDRFVNARDKVSKSFGFTMDNSQFMEYMLNKIEEDIESKGVKNPYDP
jgi:hypothetical protein|tara:strand:+ start:1044 stop:1253 length:210 start_codon:yes stop_codon:yes gene_type:complete